MSLPPGSGKNTRGAPPEHAHVGPAKKPNWLAWILLAVGILVALLALSRCNRTETPGTTTAAVGNAAVVAATTTAPVGELGDYLAGTETAPRTFALDNLNFDIAKSDIRPADQATVDKVAAVLGEYPKARIRVAGYADARGSEASNLKLGSDRAQALKTALVAKGVDAGRIETVSGGTDDPVATNATAQGEAENRRAELVVLSH